ncbi:MAG: HAD-IA family hydrolase [Pseudomonadota bacterium]
MSADVRVIAWDFDGVLNRNVVDGRFTWIDDFERDLGLPPGPFEETVFGHNLDDVLTGREDVRDRIVHWAQEYGFSAGADAMLEYWFQRDVRPDAEMLELMDALTACGMRQVLVTNNEPRRTAFIENEMGFGARVEHIFASGRMGIAKPAAEFYARVTGALQVERAEILIVDDLSRNVEAAVHFGWQGLHFTPQTRGEVASCLRSNLLTRPQQLQDPHRG